MAEKRVLLTVTCIDTPSVRVSFEPEGAEHLLLAGDWSKVEIVGTKTVSRRSATYRTG